MDVKKEETASFMLRFTQKIFKNENGEPQVQWRGNIRHVQGGDEKRFSEFDEVVAFIQNKLADLTIQALENKSPEEQKSILAKNFDLWKKMAIEGPKMVIETFKDPKKQIENFQDQMHQVKEEIGQKLEDTLLRPSKADYKQILTLLEGLSTEISTLNKKVDQLSKKKSK
ncbi:MAG: hypothetical protein DHS20C18_09020 [Saprospiraceae bacterium]|nr:MAG: hypothetical protein DHS20C18_09020 [Saprospiraceae bacterium]